jgi:hypothetical protein
MQSQPSLAFPQWLPSASTASSSTASNLANANASIVSAGGGASSSSSNNLTARHIIELKLDDFIISISKLLHKLTGPVLPPTAISSNLSFLQETSSKTSDSSSSSSSSSSASLESIIAEITAQDKSLQEAVDMLIENYRLQQKRKELEEEIRKVDTQIIQFGKNLSRFEWEFYRELSGPSSTHARRWDGSVALSKQRFSVKEVTVLAERLAVTSAPPEFVEQAGLGLVKPPAPQEELMSTSSLYLSVAELLKMAEDHRKAGAEQTITAQQATTYTNPSQGIIDSETVERITARLGDAVDPDIMDLGDEDPEALAALWGQF